MKLRLSDLAHMHPSLLRAEIAAATAAVLDGRGFPRPHHFPWMSTRCPNSAPPGSISKSRGLAFPRTTSAGFAAPGTALDLSNLPQSRLPVWPCSPLAGTRFAMPLCAARRRITWSMQMAICGRSPAGRGESTLRRHGRSAGRVSWSVPAPGFTFAFVSSTALPPDWPLRRKVLP